MDFASASLPVIYPAIKIIAIVWNVVPDNLVDMH